MSKFNVSGIYKHITLSICDVALTPLAIFWEEAAKVEASEFGASPRTAEVIEVNAPATEEIVPKIDVKLTSPVTGFY